MIRSNRRTAVAPGLMALAIGLVLAGCSTTTATPTSSTTSPSGLITTTTVHYVPRYVTVGGHAVLMPTEKGHEPITAYSAFGQNIIITTKGFEPSKLYAAATAPIVFTNLTDATQEVVFHDFPNVANSGPIPPGESYALHYSDAINLGYGNRSGSENGLLYIGGCPPDCG